MALTITPERIEEMWQAVRKYGSGNCWTGTTGTLAVMIFQLLQELDALEAKDRSND